VKDGKINRGTAKKVLIAVIEDGVDPEVYCKEQGFEVQADETLIASVIDEAIAANPAAVADYRAGKEKALMAIFGACMKQLRGNGDPQVIKALLEQKLKD